MSAKDFKFVSPGVFIEEIDNSQVPKSPVAIGPLVIGRTRRGPAYQPVRVDSFSEFVTIFGNPVAGEEASDLWRDGKPTAPTFAAYAAQAWLKNSSPLTVIRLLGDQSPNAADTANGKAGWKLSDIDAATGGGAYGLFLMPSSSDAAETPTGTLAAVFYTKESILTLSGTLRGVEDTLPVPQAVGGDGGGVAFGSATGSAALIVGDNGKFTLQSYNSSQVLQEETSISFNRSASDYIRKVVNTNPTLTNTDLVDTSAANSKTFFLGQSYERAVGDLGATNYYGFIARLDRVGSPITNGNDFKFATQAAQTGWFFSQDLRNTAASGDPTENDLTPIYDPASLSGVTRLFKLHGLTSGEEVHKSFKISIEDLKYSSNDNLPYGSFTLAIRDIKDTDNSKKYVERYTNLSLDPNSDSYIAKQIGDKYYEWSTDQRRLIEYGSYPNRSSIVRVEVANAVDQAQTDPELLPFGSEGPIKYSDFNISGSNVPNGLVTGSIAVDGTTEPAAPITVGNAGDIFMGPNTAVLTGDFELLIAGEGTSVATPTLTASINFPSIPLRHSASDGDLSDPTEAYFGAQFTRTAAGSTFEESNWDILYPLPSANTFAPVSDAQGNLVTSWYFSLDDLIMAVGSDSNPQVYYASGSREAGDSITARTGSYKAVIDKGYDRFTTPMYGGFDGFDITEKEPFNTERALLSSATETNSAMFYSVKKAVDMFADPEFIEANILTAPGILNEGLTTHMLQTCESRGDAMAIIDPLGGYKPASENDDNEQTRITAGSGRGGVSQHVLEVGNNLDSRNLNTSYGATYYPWVRITDTISGRNLWAPPSIAAIGAMSFSENEAALWFAPAGFNRGGLTDGAAGIPVTNVRSRLTSAERDFLYERSINPIATFPNEGIVIFGQKTLQVTPSALDRINVRRLMIFVKKEISRIAANLLFDQNTEQTWSRFTGQVNPFLDNIKNNFGLDDFRVILDETTTTPDLIDRNTIYAKIFLKPTKAVEFFAIDFVITNSGAGFED